MFNLLKRIIKSFMYLALWHCIAASFLSCNTSKNTSLSGCIVITPKFYDTTLNDYIIVPEYGPPQKIWYKDSLAIEEVTGIYITKDTSQIEKRHIGVFYYTYMNLRTKSFYRYNFFSDTARPIKIYIGPDTTDIDGP